MSGRPEFITLFSSPTLAIIAVSQGMDNYAYVLANEVSGEAALVDAMEAQSILALEEVLGIKICTIFNTHHHGDHVGANSRLKKIRDGEGLNLEIYGSSFDYQHHRIAFQSKVVGDGDTINWAHHQIKVLEIPGHTSGHLGYLLNDHLFCGDTVFLGGCGRLFEGTPTQMYHSIHKKIGTLNPHTKLYPAHEYSLQNLKFAAYLLEDEALVERTRELEVKLSSEGTTLPTTVAHEYLFNPFFRIASEDYRRSLGFLDTLEKQDPVHAFAKIRSMKDSF